MKAKLRELVEHAAVAVLAVSDAIPAEIEEYEEKNAELLAKNAEVVATTVRAQDEFDRRRVALEMKLDGERAQRGILETKIRLLEGALNLPSATTDTSKSLHLSLQHKLKLAYENLTNAQESGSRAVLRNQALVHELNLKTAECFRLQEELKAAKEGLQLPGWTCPCCLTFNGSAKETLDTCRACGQKPERHNDEYCKFVRYDGDLIERCTKGFRHDGEHTYAHYCGRCPNKIRWAGEPRHCSLREGHEGMCIYNPAALVHQLDGVLGTKKESAT